MEKRLKFPQEMSREYKRALNMLGDVRAYLSYTNSVYDMHYDLELIRNSMIQQYGMNRQEVFSLPPQEFVDKLASLSSETPLGQTMRLRAMDSEERKDLPEDVLQEIYKFEIYASKNKFDILKYYTEYEKDVLIPMLISDIQDGRTFDKGNEGEIGKTIYEIVVALYKQRKEE